MSNDIYKGMLWNDGEGLSHEDLNNGQNRLKAILFDMMIQNQIPDLRAVTSATGVENFAPRGADAPTHLCYTLHPGAGYPIQGPSGDGYVGTTPGVILQKIAASDGEEAQLLAYNFLGTEEVAIAAGNGSQYRMDLVQLKLEWEDGGSESRDFKDGTTGAITTTTFNKKRRVKCTMSVKQGAYHATAPVIPDPDSGYVAYATVVVEPNYIGSGSNGLIFNGGLGWLGNNAFVHDQRMPIGCRSYTLDAMNMRPGTAWTRYTDEQYMYNTSTTNAIYGQCPTLTGRLIGIEINHAALVGTSANSYSLAFCVASIGPNGGGTNYANPIRVVSTLLGDSSTDLHQDQWRYKDFEGQITTILGALPVQSSVNKIGIPVWANGTGIAVVTGSTWRPANYNGMGFYCQNWSASKIIAHVTFFMAQGL